MHRRLKEVEEKLAQAKKEKDAYEKKFIEAKMSLSEVQMQNQGNCLFCCIYSKTCKEPFSPSRKSNEMASNCNLANCIQ